MNGKPFFLAILFGAGTLPSFSGAADPGSQRLSLEGGAAFPTSANNFSSDSKTGPMGGIQYLYNLDYWTAVGVQADYYHFGAQNQTLNSDAGGQLNAQSTDDAVTLEIMGRYTFLPESRVMPYIHSGVGINYFHQTTNGEPVAGSSWADTNTTETRQLQDVTTIGFSYSIGAGVETNLTKNIVLGLEAAWRILGVSKTVYGTSTLNMATVSLRLGWGFSGEAVQNEIPTPP